MADEAAGLRDSIEHLDGTIGDLRVTVGVLGVAVTNLAERASEDRDRTAKLGDRVRVVESWKSKINGGLVLVGTALAATGSVLVAYILK